MKKPSEFFKNMDEVRSFVEHICDQTSLSEDERQELLFLCGLAENRALTVPVILDGVETLIDQHIAPIITDLNERGIQTIASCSGLQSEHKESLHPPKCGYLALTFHPALLLFLKNNLDDASFIVRESEVYLKQAITVDVLGDSDEELKVVWNTLWLALKASAAMGEHRQKG